MKDKRLVWATAGAIFLVGAGLLAYAVSGLTAGRPVRPVFSPDWQSCDLGEACVAVQAPCGEWQPVNWMHEADAAAYYSHLITVVETTGMECVSTNLSRTKPAAYCLSGTCSFAQ